MGSSVVGRLFKLYCRVQGLEICSRPVINKERSLQISTVWRQFFFFPEIAGVLGGLQPHRRRTDKQIMLHHLHHHFHPLVVLMTEYCQEDPRFGHCVDVTIFRISAGTFSSLLSPLLFSSLSLHS